MKNIIDFKKFLYPQFYNFFIKDKNKNLLKKIFEFGKNN